LEELQTEDDLPGAVSGAACGCELVKSYPCAEGGRAPALGYQRQHFTLTIRERFIRDALSELRGDLRWQQRVARVHAPNRIQHFASTRVFE
jgi:hypothetical protein